MMIRFDTRNKKPKVWNIAVLSAIMVVVESILLSRKEKPEAAVFAVLAIYLVLTIVFLLIAFVKQLQYNPYSYNTIYYMGFAIFLTGVVIFVFLEIGEIRRAGIMGYEAVYSMAYNLLSTAKRYLFITFPVILVYSAALCISNISLIRHEGKRLVNLLGIILSILLVGGMILLYFADRYTSGTLEEVMVHDILTNLFAAFYLYFESMLIGTIIANIIVVRYKPPKDKDFMIILGCGIQKDGKPTPLLKGRIDRAIRFAKEQMRETGKELIFVPSGGKGDDEVVSECEAMKQYLLQQGIHKDRILEEDRSASTYENMLYSKKKILDADPEAKVIFATTNYHIFRAGLLARRVKMRAVGIGARTKWYFWPNAAVREFVGILTEHRLKQSLILGGMILIYVISTIVLYSVLG